LAHARRGLAFGFQIRWSEARANLMKALIVPSKDTPYGPLQTV
jgi:hypothetical protein